MSTPYLPTKRRMIQRRDGAALLARDPAGEGGQRLLGQQVLRQDGEAIGQKGDSRKMEGDSIERFVRGRQGKHYAEKPSARSLLNRPA